LAETVTIDYLGGLGDGVASTPAGRLHIPYAAPGDRATVTVTGKESARLDEVLSPGPSRVASPCVHFGRCGGCALQHLDAAFVAGWKRERIVNALARAGLENIDVAPTISITPGTRRRATFAAKRFGDRVRLGFYERASHQIVDLTECPVLKPELAALIEPLRAALSLVLNAGETADIAVTLTETGIDLTLIRLRPLTLIDREELAKLAEAFDLARISWRSKIDRQAEPVAARRTPRVRFGQHAVPLAPGGFLQPSVEGELALTGLVLKSLGKPAGPIVDIFSGAGTFALPASALGPVFAYDNDADAVASLQAAGRAAQVRITAARRDLFREPLTLYELRDVAAVIIDPPRVGALAQARMLALSEAQVIASVSCNAVSFARDAAILTDGGYRLESVTPVDQFHWSPHVELVGVFRR
jgi:23S rRNA (uracil1939-C5)-methyltransferase